MGPGGVETEIISNLTVINLHFKGLYVKLEKRNGYNFDTQAITQYLLKF